jgi:hypothetical protein
VRNLPGLLGADQYYVDYKQAQKVRGKSVAKERMKAMRGQVPRRGGPKVERWCEACGHDQAEETEMTVMMVRGTGKCKAVDRMVQVVQIVQTSSAGESDSV